MLYLPEATKLAVASQLDGLRLVYRAASRWSTLVIVLVAGVGFLTAPALSELIYPKDPGTTTELLRILFAGYGFQGALGPAYPTLVAVGAYRQIRNASLAFIPAILVLTIGLTQAFGVVGAACATLGCYVVMGIWWVVLVDRDLGAWPFDRLYLRAVIGLAATLALVAVTFRVTEPSGSLLSVSVSTVVGVAAWGAFMYLARPLTATELRIVGRLRQRVTGVKPAAVPR